MTNHQVQVLTSDEDYTLSRLHRLDRTETDQILLLLVILLLWLNA
jgi:hypothetical protein